MSCKPIVGKKILTSSKVQFEKLAKIGFKCDLLPNTLYTIDGWNEEENKPKVGDATLPHRCLYTVKRK